jgi:hypothetical protein
VSGKVLGGGRCQVAQGDELPVALQVEREANNHLGQRRYGANMVLPGRHFNLECPERQQVAYGCIEAKELLG